MTKSDLYYDDEDIRVSSKTLIINSSCYYLDDINAVFVTKLANYKRYPITLGIFTLLLGLICIKNFTGFGIFCFIGTFGCFFYAYTMKPQYILRLRTRFGEIKPLISADSLELEKIRDAILRAIAEERR